MNGDGGCRNWWLTGCTLEKIKKQSTTQLTTPVGWLGIKVNRWLALAMFIERSLEN